MKRLIGSCVHLLRRFGACRTGGTWSEYATVLAVVIIAAMVAVMQLGNKVSSTVASTDGELAMVIGAGSNDGGGHGDGDDGGSGRGKRGKGGRKGGKSGGEGGHGGKGGGERGGGGRGHGGRGR